MVEWHISHRNLIGFASYGMRRPLKILNLSNFITITSSWISTEHINIIRTVEFFICTKTRNNEMKTFRLSVDVPKYHSCTIYIVHSDSIPKVEWFETIYLWNYDCYAQRFSISLWQGRLTSRGCEVLIVCMVWSPVVSNYSAGGGRRAGASPPIAARHR